MTAITQQDMPQTETTKLQHIATTKRASTSSTCYRIGSTRFHTSAQKTVGSGAFVSAWLFLENIIPLQQWRKMELFHQNFAFPPLYYLDIFHENTAMMKYIFISFKLGR